MKPQLYRLNRFRSTSFIGWLSCDGGGMAAVAGDGVERRAYPDWPARPIGGCGCRDVAAPARPGWPVPSLGRGPAASGRPALRRAGRRADWPADCRCCPRCGCCPPLIRPPGRRHCPPSIGRLIAGCLPTALRLLPPVDQAAERHRQKSVQAAAGTAEQALAHLFELGIGRIRIVEDARPSPDKFAAAPTGRR